MGRLEAGEGIQNQFVEAQQIDFGGSGRGKAGGWEVGFRAVGRLEAGSHRAGESKINFLRLNKC